MVEHETVLPSQEDDCHTVLADFRKDQFSIHDNDKRQNNKVKPLVSVSFEAVKPFQSPNKKPIRKSTNTIIQQSPILEDTDNDDLFGKKTPQKDHPFSPDSTLNNNPFLFDKNFNSKTENLKLQTIRETYPSVINRSLIHLQIFCVLFTS